MTLLIAGYTFDPLIDHTFSFDEAGFVTNSTPQPDTGAPVLPRKTKPSGIFVVADSAITSGVEPLLAGYEKIYPIAVKLWMPQFTGDFFHKYASVCRETEIVVGFAGSTLMAQHYINNLTRHLSLLRISCKPQQRGPIQYVVLMHCEPNPLNDSDKSWGDDTFTSTAADGLLTADCISNIVLHSLERSVSNARQDKISHASFKTLLTPFIAGIQCPTTLCFRLYVFKMNCKTDAHGVVQVRVKKQLVSENAVAVLGLVKEFESNAQTVYTNARNEGEATEIAMRKFLNEAIDKVKQRGEKSIDYPTTLKVLDQNGLSRSFTR